MREIKLQIRKQYLDKILAGNKKIEFRLADFEIEPGDNLFVTAKPGTGIMYIITNSLKSSKKSYNVYELQDICGEYQHCRIM